MARIADPKEMAPRAVDRTPDMRALVEGMIRAVQNIEFPSPQVSVSPPASAAPVVEVTMPEPVQKWVFSVQRDKDGYIKAITATAGTK